MKKRLRSCRPIRSVCVLTLLALCAQANAQPVARPEFSVGDTWTFVYSEGSRTTRPGTYRSTVVRTITGIQADRYETTLVTTPEGGEAKRLTPHISRDFNDYAPPGLDGSQQEIRTWSWPLDADQTWTYEAATPAGVQRWRARVVGWETVEVPAGSFRALKVEREVLSNPNPLVYQKVTVWYSPEAKQNVRMDYHATVEGSMTIRRDTRELTSYRLH